MPYFTCTECGQEVCIMKNDWDVYHSRKWVCEWCRLVISKRDYPMNLRGRTTLFSSVGDSLGDKTVFEVVKRMYKKDNPDETVVFLGPYDDHAKAVHEYRAAKFFVGEFCRNDLCFCFKGRIDYNIMNEVCEYARRGIYPELEYVLDKPKMDLPEKYVVCHFRNIEKTPKKPHPKRNVSPELARRVVKTIQGFRLPVLLIGNDDPLGISGVTDLTHKLSLGEIAWLCKNAVLFCGRDSGIVHVAAAAKSKIVAWDFHPNGKWYPKAPEKNWTGISHIATTDDRVIQEIREALEGAHGKGAEEQ